MTIKPWADRIIDGDVKGATVAMLAEIDELRVELEKIKSQQPVARVYDAGGMQLEVEFLRGQTPEVGSELYLSAGAQPAPDVSLMAGWIRAADEEMICTNLGVANLSDSYESAKAKLKMLIDWHVSVSADSAVNGGYQLVPSEPTEAMLNAPPNAWSADALITYKAMLKAVKP